MQRMTAFMKREAGGAALEYILVSTFAAVVGIAALTFVGKIMERELANMAEKLGFGDAPELENPFGDLP